MQQCFFVLAGASAGLSSGAGGSGISKKHWDWIRLFFIATLRKKQNRPLYIILRSKRFVLRTRFAVGKGEQAYSFLQEIIDYNLKNHVNPESMRYLMMMIAGTILHAVGSLDEDIRSKIPIQTLKGIFEKESLPQNRTRLQECIDQITRAIHTVREKDACREDTEPIQKSKEICGRTLYGREFERRYDCGGIWRSYRPIFHGCLKKRVGIICQIIFSRCV